VIFRSKLAFIKSFFQRYNSTPNIYSNVDLQGKSIQEGREEEEEILDKGAVQWNPAL